MNVKTSRAVRARAGARCQYCLIHESLQGATFHVEQVIPQGKGGRSELENLALACPGCNLHKASRNTAINPATAEDVRLFHLIRQLWSQPFRFNGYRIEGPTCRGPCSRGGT
jgi:5-methylcytosine-specific restriction endonuclease McrA